jgi:lipopolysaccharide biosynthesis glycosyltransferase
MRKLIVTLCIGDKFKELGDLTHPNMIKYANKVGADFKVIDENKFENNLCFNKLQMLDMLDKYDRILYLDSDVLVGLNCPDLFQEYKYGQMAMLDESPFLDYSKNLKSMAEYYKIDINIEDNPTYFNAGVILFDRSHKSFLQMPEELGDSDIVNGKFTMFDEYKDFTEQTYFNLMIRKYGIDVEHLSFRYNRCELMDSFTKEHRYQSYIIHYAGFQDFDELINVVYKDIPEWNKSLRTWKPLPGISMKPLKPLSTTEWVWTWGQERNDDLEYYEIRDKFYNNYNSDI